MNVGFKTGPRNWEEEGKPLVAAGAKLCEVWFDVTKADEYEAMLHYLQEHEVAFGLHHWGVVDGKYKTNLATNHERIREETGAQIRQTIDIGQELGAAYVNAHPGARYVETIQFEPWQQELVEEELTSEAESREIFLKSTRELAEYAQNRKVLLTIETLPAQEMHGYKTREDMYDPCNVPLPIMEEMAQQGVWLANDITHTAAQLAMEDSSREAMWEGLYAFTKRTAAQTRLLHVNTVTPPFNGTDSHNGLTDTDFAAGAFPSREQIKELLSLFADRDDVFAIPEPQDGAAMANWQELTKLASSLLYTPGV